MGFEEGRMGGGILIDIGFFCLNFDSEWIERIICTWSFFFWQILNL